MTHMLADVVNHGTAYPARQLGFKLPAAGKTGTTNDYRDAWFVGYTPRLVTGVWVGFDQPQTIVSRGYAATVAVPLWAGFMKKATADDPADWYKAPAGIVARRGVQTVGQAARRALLRRDHAHRRRHRGDRTQRLHRVFRPRHAARRDLRRPCQCLNLQSSGWLGRRRLADHTHTRPSGRPKPRPCRGAGGAQAASRAEEPTATAEEAPKKKRGFWSRVFGRDDKNDEKETSSALTLP